MSEQIASGTGNIQVLVKESENVAIELNGARIASLWVPPFRRPLPENAKNKELALLLATTAITDLVGRDGVWKECLKWCKDSELDSVSVVCIKGRGGSGKTRFALELVHHLRQMEGWDARFVRFQRSEPLDLWANTGGSNHVLLVFDYAPDQAALIADSLRLLAENPPRNPNRRLRILLLARDASLGSGWLLNFEPASTLEVGQSPRDLFRRGSELIELSPLTIEDRIRVFVQAYEKAAELLGIPKRPIDETVFRNRHAGEVLKDPLSVIMAAIVGLQNGVPNALSLHRTQLAREAAHLLVARRLQVAFPDNPAIALHAAAYATLTGGISAGEAPQVLEIESEALHLGQVADPSGFAARLAAWLPGADGDLIGPIEPDVVGEAHILNQLSLRKDKAIQVLFRATRDRPKQVFQSLIRTVQDYCLAPGEVDLQPLNWLRELIETGRTDDTQLLMEINGVLPESSVALRRESLSLRRKLCEHLSRLASDSVQMDARDRQGLRLMQALSFNLLSTSQSEMGLTDEALENATASVMLISELAKQNPLVYDLFLAEYLNDLGNRQRDSGQNELALRSSEESVRLMRELVARDREALPTLAKSVNNLGIGLRALGRLNESLQCAEEAVSIYRDLTKGNRDEYLPVLAGFLGNLSNSQSSVGRRDAALASAKESETYFRELTARKRDAYLPNLAMTLTNLSVMQSEDGKIEDALLSAQEAASLLRELTAFNRDAFLLRLSVALNNLAGRQASAGRREDALVNAREAVEITHELLGRNQNAYIFDHTKSCGRLGMVLAELGRYAEAADVFAEGLRETLPSLESNPGTPLVRQAYLLCAGYLQATEKGSIDRDWPLLTRAMPIFTNYVKELGDQNDRSN